MPRDLSKYQFNGQKFSKNRLVLAVVKEYVAKHQPTFTQLNEAFPINVRGRKGIFCTEQEFNEKFKSSSDIEKRYFIKKMNG